jgi:hypothetical protein
MIRSSYHGESRLSVAFHNCKTQIVTAALLARIIPSAAARRMPIVSQATTVSTGALRIRAEIRYTSG